MDKSTLRVQTDKTNYRRASLFPRILINIAYLVQFSLQSFISEMEAKEDKNMTNEIFICKDDI